MKFVLLFLCSSLIILNMVSVPSFALNLGIHSVGHIASNRESCSRTCESDYCSVPPLLRYGKYCGVLYTGCPGEEPCDDLDTCCLEHDNCVRDNDDLLTPECTEKFLFCMGRVDSEKDAETFPGNKCNIEEVIDVVSLIMDFALLAGRVFHGP